MIKKYKIVNDIKYRLDKSPSGSSFFTVVDGSDYKEETLIIPSHIDDIPVQVIGPNAFKLCTKLKNVTLPEGLTEIGRKAFSQCRYMKSINIPNSVIKIDDFAFWSCLKLKSVQFGKNIEFVCSFAFSFCISLESVSFSSKILYLASNAFDKCSNLRIIHFDTDPVNLEDPNGYALACMSNNLEKITTNENNTKYKSIDGILYDMDAKRLVRFPPNSNITSFELPKWVKSIHDEAFHYGNKLVFIKIHQKYIPNLEKNSLMRRRVNVYCHPDSDVNKQFIKNDFVTKPIGSGINTFLDDLAENINTTIECNI